MDRERIEENRKYVNAGEESVFNYVEDLGLWMIGGFGPVDIQPDGIKFEHISPSVFPNCKGSLLPYITECDAAEGFSVYKFKAPFLMVVGILQEWISILSNVPIMEQPILLVQIRLFCIHSF